MPCPHCDKVYATVYDLKRHAVHHDESLKPRCSVCDRVFTSKVNLRKHVEKYHDHSSAALNGVGAVVSGVRKSRAPVAGQNGGVDAAGRQSSRVAGTNSLKNRAAVADADHPPETPTSVSSAPVLPPQPPPSSYTIVLASPATKSKRRTEGDAETVIYGKEALFASDDAVPENVVFALDPTATSTMLSSGSLAESSTGLVSLATVNANSRLSTAPSSIAPTAAPAAPTGAVSAGILPTMTSTAGVTQEMGEACFGDGQARLATLELVSTEPNEEGSSLTLALQPLAGETSWPDVQASARCKSASLLSFNVLP